MNRSIFFLSLVIVMLGGALSVATEFPAGVGDRLILGVAGLAVVLLCAFRLKDMGSSLWGLLVFIVPLAHLLFSTETVPCAVVAFSVPVVMVVGLCLFYPSSPTRPPRELLEPWSPVADLPPTLWLESLHGDLEELDLLLVCDEPSSRQLSIRFELPYAFRSIDEGHRLNSDLGSAGTFFRVQNSRWIEWLVEESAGILKAENRPITRSTRPMIASM